MSAALAERPEAVLDDTDDTLSHFYCCDETKALCGSSLDGAEFEGDDGDVDCIVCVSLEASMRGKPCASATCPKRGAA